MKNCQAKRGTTANQHQDIKLVDIIEEITEIVVDVFQIVSETMWTKKTDTQNEESNNNNVKNKWSFNKLYKNVKYGYKTIVEFLPSFEMSREAISDLMPIFSNVTFTELLQKYIY